MQNMNRSNPYSPLEESRRWRIKPPRQRSAPVPSSTVVFKHLTGKRITNNAQRLLSRITRSPAKTVRASSSHANEAEIPVIFFGDEDTLTDFAEKEKVFVDPFEANTYASKEKNISTSHASFKIVGTFRYFPTLDTIIENELQENETKALDSVPSPTSINVAETFDYSPKLAPMRLFAYDSVDRAADSSRVDADIETISFEGINFEEDNLDLSRATKCMSLMDFTGATNENDESLEVWVNSTSMRNGFTKAKGFQSHDWND